MYISFDIEGEKQLSRRLKNISVNVKNWLPETRKIGKYLIKIFSGPVFKTEGSEIGEPWSKRTKPYPWPILEKTGKMRKGFKSTAGLSQVAIYNTASYFKFHQSNKPRRKLPRRVMMKLDNQRKFEVVKIFQKRIIKILHG